MKLTGRFKISLNPQNDEDFPAGRMTFDKEYLGDMNGVGKGQMISKRNEGDVAVYYAIEEFSGSVSGRNGSFTLLHQGQMSKSAQLLKVVIMEGSGEGNLEGISGSLAITQDEEGHTYALDYQLASA